MRGFGYSLEEVERPTAIIFDNERRSIAEHEAIAAKHDTKVVIAKTLPELQEQLLKGHWHPILFADMHMPDIADLREIGHPSIKTDNGENVAIAIIRGYMKVMKLGHIPARVLTGYPLSVEANRQIKRAANQGMDVDFLMKEDIAGYEETIKAHLEKNPSGRAKKFLLLIESFASGLGMIGRAQPQFSDIRRSRRSNGRMCNLRY